MGKLLAEGKLGTYAELHITDQAILHLVKAVLQEASDVNAERPASSSGKYHPVSDQGPGGNVRHSVLVAEVCSALMRAEPAFDNPREHDVMIAACLLHDICKYDDEHTEHTQFRHPALAAELIKRVGGRNHDAIRIAQIVASHMGRWNTSQYEPGTKLLKPKTLQQKLLHYADLIAANKELPLKIAELTSEAEEELKR